MILIPEVNIYFSASDLSDSHHSKAPQDSSTNFLLQVTLLPTSTPVVNRLLTVPPKALFETLHEAMRLLSGGAIMRHRMERLANFLDCAG